MKRQQVHMCEYQHMCDQISSSTSRNHKLIPYKNNTCNMILSYINVLFVVVIKLCPYTQNCFKFNFNNEYENKRRGNGFKITYQNFSL